MADFDKDLLHIVFISPNNYFGIDGHRHDLATQKEAVELIHSQKGNMYVRYDFGEFRVLINSEGTIEATTDKKRCKALFGELA